MSSQPIELADIPDPKQGPPSDWPLPDNFYTFAPNSCAPATPSGRVTPSVSRSKCTPPEHPERSGSDAESTDSLSSLDAQLLGLPSSQTPKSDDFVARAFRTYYDLNLLAGRPSMYPQEDMFMLRLKRQQAFQQADNGDWDDVFYVPPWTDPDWDSRFTFIKDAKPLDDITAQYAQPGLLQLQRPALLPKDAQYNPTDAAKRWGFYPWQPLKDGNNDPTGKSGLTPTVVHFPSLPLRRAIMASDGQPVTTVSNEDMERARREYEQRCATNRVQSSDVGFRRELEEVAGDEASGYRYYARALLALLDSTLEKEQAEAYQRFLFYGHTTQELVDKRVWNMYMSADTDLALPLHDLLQRSKWADPRQEQGLRLVYNINGKQGEYSAHNDVLWAAMQPALQITSQILSCNHPATWMFCDVRKLRPVRNWRDTLASEGTQFDGITDNERQNGVHRKNLFTVWPEFSGLAADLDPISASWDDMRGLCEAGFDTTRYACEILERTIEWRFSSQFGATRSDTLNGPPSRVMGSTAIFESSPDYGGAPLTIEIQLAADFVWQLLVDDFSAAEKASISLLFAQTILHELAHALNLARLQMSARAPSARGRMARRGRMAFGDAAAPLWLTLNPHWPIEIAELSASTGLYILELLQAHGDRWTMVNHRRVWGIMSSNEEVFVEDQPEAEEGSATEYQYFGGCLERLGDSNPLNEMIFTRHLGDICILPSLRRWPLVSTQEYRSENQSAIPAEEYLRFFRKSFWDTEFARIGHEALRLGTAYRPALYDWEEFSWVHVTRKFGVEASTWIQYAWERVRYDSDCQILWRWLYYCTVEAVQYSAVSLNWSTERKDWSTVDSMAWWIRRGVLDKYNAMKAELIDLRPRPEDDGDLMMVNKVPLNEIKAFMSAVAEAIRFFSAEVTWNQNWTANFIRLDEGAGKQSIWDRYHEKMAQRMRLIYISAVQDIANCLDYLENPPDSDTQFAWLVTDEDVEYLVTQLSNSFQQMLIRLRGFYEVIGNIFSPDIARGQQAVRQLNNNLFGELPSSASQRISRRLQGMGHAQYNTLDASDARKAVADIWLHILEQGERLCSPPAGTPEAATNANMADITHDITQRVDFQRQEAETAYPDIDGERQDAGPMLPGRYGQDSSSPGQRQNARFITADDAQTYTWLSSFQPTRDDKTGFTQFQNVRSQISDNEWQVAVEPPPPPAAGDDPRRAASTELERRIVWLRNEMRQAEQQGIGSVVGRPMRGGDAGARGSGLFGASAAQMSMAQQELESLLQQRSILLQALAGQRGGNGGEGATAAGSFDPGASLGFVIQDLEEGYQRSLQETRRRLANRLQRFDMDEGVRR